MSVGLLDCRVAGKGSCTLPGRESGKGMSSLLIICIESSHVLDLT